MVSIQPFKAIRPHKDLAQSIASLPYDVVDEAEAREMTKENPHSYLRIDRSEVDLAEGESPYREEVYKKAAENLADFQNKDWLIKDQESMYYLYELTFQGQSQTGLVIGASVKDYVDGRIKKHEFTRHEKEIDRINHFDTTDANTSPIYLTYHSEDEINSIIDEWKHSYQPIYDFESYYETGHKVWVIDNEEVIDKLTDLFTKKVSALYIADGHHRTESAAKVAQKRQEQGRQSETGQYFLSVAFPVEELSIYDYNRLVSADVPEDFLTLLAEDFKIESVPAKKRRPEVKGQVGLYYDKQWYHLTLNADLVPDDLVASLDASIVQDFIFDKRLGIEKPREDDRLNFVGGIRGLDVLEEAVDQGKASFAVALYPTLKDDLLAVADLGKTMPPKSTWFEPKLLSGLFVHDLESL